MDFLFSSFFPSSFWLWHLLLASLNHLVIQAPLVVIQAPLLVMQAPLLVIQLTY